MNDQIAYPKLTDEMLSPFRVLRILKQASADMLERPECPYTEEQKTFLREMSGEVAPDRRSFMLDAEDPLAILAEQVALTLEDIRLVEKDAIRLDAKDKVAFLKLKPQLLEKLIELRERVINTRALGEFMKKVYAFIDKELTTDQRTALMRAVGTYVESAK